MQSHWSSHHSHFHEMNQDYKAVFHISVHQLCFWSDAEMHYTGTINEIA